MGLVRLKVCGMNDPENALLAASLGADALGFIFHPDSPRNLSYDQAARIIGQLPPFVTPVGVFVRQSLAEIMEVVRITGIQTVQLHGGPEHHPVSLAAEAVKKIGVPVLYAVGASELSDGFISECRKLDETVHARAYLVDSIRQGGFGGTGERVELPGIRMPENRAFLKQKVLLAGGIRPSNVAEILKQLRPYALDISSGLETEKGKKDPDKIRELFKVYFSERWRDEDGAF